MLEKTKTSDSDVFVYDLEDSVAPNINDKVTARERLKAFLAVEFFFPGFVEPNGVVIDRRIRLRTGDVWVYE